LFILLYIHENITLKPVKIVFKGGRGNERG
jgi:hypothetical protein